MYEGYRTPEQLAAPEFERLKVTLEGSNPPIWRELLIPENATFEDLHLALQLAFGWRDQHLHQFQAGFVVGPEALNEDGPVSDGNCLDERLTWLYDLPAEVGIAYRYDFGDSWDHVIERQGKVLPEGREFRPHIVGGGGAGPIEDVGGIEGWNELADSLRSGSLEDDDAERLDDDGCGRDYDPDAFDHEEADRRLAGMFFDIMPTWKRQYERRKLVRTSASFLYDRSNAVTDAGRLNGLVGRDYT